MEKDSDQSLLRIGKWVGGQGMLPTFQFCQELSMSQGWGSITMYRQVTNILDTEEYHQADPGAAWQGQLSNILKRDEKNEDRWEEQNKTSRQNQRMEADHTWRFHCRQDSLLYFSPLTFLPEGEGWGLCGIGSRGIQMISSGWPTILGVLGLRFQS